jgi:hypothetical protein
MPNSNTALSTLSYIADLVSRAERIQPTARREAIAASLRQIGEIAGDLPLTVQQVVDAFSYLGRAPAGSRDDDRTAARRATLHQIVDAVGDAVLEWELADSVSGLDFEPWLAVLSTAIAALDGSRDPRHRAMVATFRRERGELAYALA